MLGHHLSLAALGELTSSPVISRFGSDYAERKALPKRWRLVFW